MRSKKENTTGSEVAEHSGIGDRPESSAPSSKTVIPAPSGPSFFNAALQPQPTRVSLDPASFLLLTALLQELRTQNELTLVKMKQEVDKKREELTAAEHDQTEDNKRFNEIRHSLYM